MAIVTNPWIQRGLEQGLEQGLQQGMQRGAAAKAREDVIVVLETRFERVPEPLRTRIGRLDDLALLSKLHRTALTAPSVEEFERAIDTSRS